MKKTGIVLIFVLVQIITIVLVKLSCYEEDELMDRVYWDKQSSLKSPNGRYTIYEYRRKSDGDRHAAYGTYLFLQNVHDRFPGYKSYVIFAGYCINQVIQYMWLDDQQIVITCDVSEAENVRTYATRAFGIDIIVIPKIKDVSSRLNNSSDQ